MDELRSAVPDAHGGLDTWQEVTIDIDTVALERP